MNIRKFALPAGLASLLVAALPVSAETIAFPAQTGQWLFAYETVFRQSGPELADAPQKHTRNLCIRPTDSADYPKAMTKTLEQDGCSIEDYRSNGQTASFRAACPSVRFEARYENLGKNQIRFTKTVRPEGEPVYFTESGIMSHHNDKTVRCGETDWLPF
ncbi:MAG: DUF3617 family protein [Neisseria sp.]|uniref:DUF3617 family protein n=1 Tax=Neisseria sp. TaxID=192066 RepID=UPI0026DB53B9|nr:DUF3617 family protein [Neisseria sp.]MDO4641279.1 DUF3617 family protein [Neisseria sp.]